MKWRYIGMECLYILIKILVISSKFLSFSAEENFSCLDFPGDLHYVGNANHAGVIIPKEDIIEEVGSQLHVICRFNDAFINAEDVKFSVSDSLLPTKIINSTTVAYTLHHSKPEKYTLYCNQYDKDQLVRSLCSRIVSIGYPPLDVVNFACYSNNNENVNCSWQYPTNPVLTSYNQVNFVVPGFTVETKCPGWKPGMTACFWSRSERNRLRIDFEVLISASNPFGSETFVHRVNLLEIVIPYAASVEVEMVDKLRAKIKWKLPSMMDVFVAGLYHSVDYRVEGDAEWKNVTLFFHRHPHQEKDSKKEFSTTVDLPYSFTVYEFRVRLHTGVLPLRDEMWSDYEPYFVTTEPTRPSVAPEVSLGSFEVDEMLDSRDIYVNFKDIPIRDQAGPNFHYDFEVYDANSRIRLPYLPDTVTRAFAKFTKMNFTDYRFRITPVNDEGRSAVYSEVVVPTSECMPRKKGVFAVIMDTVRDSPWYSLYWVPFDVSTTCRTRPSPIDSYTIFWCKKTAGSRCKEKLSWKTIGVEELSVKDLSHVTDEQVVIYEFNMTDPAHYSSSSSYSQNSSSFPSDTAPFSFGIAANAGSSSSGISWSGCLVDGSEKPQPPNIDLKSLSNESDAIYVSWKPQCVSLSAVPVGFKISYCKSRVADFGHCDSEVRYVHVKSPSVSSTIVRDLDSGFSYIFSVAVRTIIGEGVTSPPSIIKLRINIPSGPPTSLKALIVGNSSVDLEWNLPDELERGGPITEYKISLRPMDLYDFFVKASPDGLVKYSVTDLKPFTSYTLIVSACNDVGCGYKDPAKVFFKTAAGVPDAVSGLNLDISNWRLLWTLENCNGVNCSFDLRVPYNETEQELISTTENSVSLRDIGVICNFTEMVFEVRAVSRNESGHFFYGNWSRIVKDSLDCPLPYLPWWAICIIVFICAALSCLMFIFLKLGWRTIMKAFNDCKQNINLPKGIEVSEAKKGGFQEFSFASKSVYRDGGGSASMNGYPNGVAFPREAKKSPENDCNDNLKSRLDSVSSDEVKLIDSTDCDGRLGGMRVSDSAAEPDEDAAGDAEPVFDDHPDTAGTSLALANTPTEMALRKKMAPAIFPHDNISVGYVSAWSVPSLPRLCGGKNGTEGRDGPDSVCSEALLTRIDPPGGPWKRRASTGYIVHDANGAAVSPPKTDYPPDAAGLRFFSDTKPGYVSLARRGSDHRGPNQDSSKTFKETHEKNAPPPKPTAHLAAQGYVSAKYIGKLPDKTSSLFDEETFPKSSGGDLDKVNASSPYIKFSTEHPESLLRDGHQGHPATSRNIVPDASASKGMSPYVNPTAFSTREPTANTGILPPSKHAINYQSPSISSCHEVSMV